MLDLEHSSVVDDAISSRRSIRSFLPDPVADETLRGILAVAARAPSGTNTQPWKVYVLRGVVKEQLSAEIGAAYDNPKINASHVQEYQYYPTQWVSPYIDRRRKVGWDLYTLLGIEKGDKARMHAQHARNYQFFGAPVGMIFTIDRMMEKGSWLDYGMFLQNIMIAARGRGLATCPQVSFTQFHRIIADRLSIPANETMVCGMSLGYADDDAIENTLATERASLDEWAIFA